MYSRLKTELLFTDMTMKHIGLSKALYAVLASAALVSMSPVSAAPIFSQADAFSVASSNVAAASVGAASGALFSHMGMNGGHQHSVVFLGDDNSTMIGYYAKGPWQKSAFLRAWQHVGGGQEIVPTVEVVSRLPEPSTFALLGLGLFAVVILRRRQTNR